LKTPPRCGADHHHEGKFKGTLGAYNQDEAEHIHQFIHSLDRHNIGHSPFADSHSLILSHFAHLPTQLETLFCCLQSHAPRHPPAHDSWSKRPTAETLNQSPSYHSTTPGDESMNPSPIFVFFVPDPLTYTGSQLSKSTFRKNRLNRILTLHAITT